MIEKPAPAAPMLQLNMIEGGYPCFIRADIIGCIMPAFAPPPSGIAMAQHIPKQIGSIVLSGLGQIAVKNSPEQVEAMRQRALESIADN